MTTDVPDGESDVLVVGASTAGLRAAEAAVRAAPELTVTVVGDEVHLPYELPPLSKHALADELAVDDLVYPLARDLRDRGVRFRLGSRAVGLDLGRREVELADGRERFRAWWWPPAARRCCRRRSATGPTCSPSAASRTPPPSVRRSPTRPGRWPWSGPGSSVVSWPRRW